jgi:hypothetical protein
MLYKLVFPAQAAGSNKVYWDLFNASGSGIDVVVVSLMPFVAGSSIVTGTLAVDLYLTRTTTIGTGGTAANYESATLTTPNFASLRGRGSPVDRAVSARAAPSGGAAAGSFLALRSIFTEETNAGTYAQRIDMARPAVDDIDGIIVHQGSGLRVVQGSVASVGNIAFDMILRVERQQ